MTRVKRLIEIRRIIRYNKVSNQEEMLTLLDKAGYKYTQATLSRDLKYLKAGKIPDEEKGQIYFLPEELQDDIPGESHLKNTIKKGFLSIEYSGNMAVIKTLPGFASGIALEIDSLKAFEIIGTIAGDDTILIISREGVERKDLHNLLTSAVPGEEN